MKRVWRSEGTLHFSLMEVIYAWTTVRPSLGTWWLFWWESKHSVGSNRNATWAGPSWPQLLLRQWQSWSGVLRTQALEADRPGFSPASLSPSSYVTGGLTSSKNILVCKIEIMMLISDWKSYILHRWFCPWTTRGFAFHLFSWKIELNMNT